MISKKQKKLNSFKVVGNEINHRRLDCGNKSEWRMCYRNLLIGVIYCLLSVSVVWAGECGSGYCTGSSAWTVASASYEDVNYCINTCATYGDIINIPSGDKTWIKSITISKDLRIVGAGIDSTILRSNFGDEVHQVFFRFQPDATARERVRTHNSEGIIEVAGFTFVGNGPEWKDGTHDGVMIYNKPSGVTTDVSIRRVIIHQNKFMEMHRAIEIYGDVFGVVYENTFQNANLSYPVGREQYSWNNLESVYGTEDNLFFEDNTISGRTFIGGGQGMRYLLRYNSGSGRNEIAGTFDMHGNQPSGVTSTMITEVYGNKWTDYHNGGAAVDQRGGKTLFFFNQFSGDDAVLYMKAREEYCDSISPIDVSLPQYVNDSYYFNNQLNGVSQSVYIAQNSCPTEHAIAENVDFSNYNEHFDGKMGVGCGTLAEMPATCSVGVTYWATNQSCANLAGMVGRHPATPIMGTLYKCTAQNTWAKYYTPYTYPHPLRNDTTSYSENPQSSAPTIAVSPTAKDFGILPINTFSPVQTFTVTTIGGDLKVDALSVTGTDATQFTIQNDSCTGKIIAPTTGSCTFDVKFSPSSVGAKAANVAIVDNDSNTSKLIAVNGTGTSQIPAISFSPTSLSFSNVLSGTLSSPQTINVSNNSANFATISSVSLSGTDANQFSIPAATDYCTGETVAASGNCSFQIIFSPTSGGEKTANVNLTALYYSSPATLPLYGSAVVYPAPKIKISRKK